MGRSHSLARCFSSCYFLNIEKFFCFFGYKQKQVMQLCTLVASFFDILLV
jgi:hypothetical protein